MPFCTTCKLENEPAEVYESHNTGQWSKCVYHDRYSKGDKKTPVHVGNIARDHDADVSLVAELPFDSRSVGGIAATGASSNSTFSEETPAKDLVKALCGGKITQREVKFHLTVALASSTSSTARSQLQDTLNAVEKFDIGDLQGAPKTESQKEIINNMHKHGKLVGSLISAHHRIALTFHVKLQSSGGSGLKQVYQLENGEKVVPYKANDDINDIDLFHRVLNDWCYVVVLNGYLTLTESKAVDCFVCDEILIDPESCKYVYRATIEMLKIHDADPSVSLLDIYAKHRDSTLVQVKRIAGYAGYCVPCVETADKDTGAPQDKSNQTIPGFAPGSKKLVVRWPRRGQCWAWTNGKPCTQLDNQGKCLFEAWHNVCGKPYKEGPQNRSCKGKHKAVDCPDH